MRTLTEFSCLSIKTAIQKANELSASGKTPEELPAALAEALKSDADKLKLLMAAVEVAKPRMEGLKRVVVLTVAEGEKVPGHAEKKEDHYYLPEFYPVAEKPQARGRHGEDDRGRGKGRGGKGGRDGGKRGEGRGAPRGGDNPRSAGGRPPGGGSGGPRPAIGGDRPAGEGRGPRGPKREPRPQQPVHTGPSFIKPVGGGAPIAVGGAKPAAAAASPATAAQAEAPAPQGTEGGQT